VRAIVLDEFDDWFQLDEPTAMRLYDVDRAAAAFILKRLPVSFWRQDKRVMWEKLGALAAPTATRSSMSRSTAS
jgi:hypothetical protein